MDTSPSHVGGFPDVPPARRCEPAELAFASIHLGLLLERIGDGDKHAFSQLYELTGHALFDYLAALLPGLAETEETFARVYGTIWVTAPQFLGGGTTPSRWILAIVRTEAQARSVPRSAPLAR